MVCAVTCNYLADSMTYLKKCTIPLLTLYCKRFKHTMYVLQCIWESIPRISVLGRISYGWISSGCQRRRLRDTVSNGRHGSGKERLNSNFYVIPFLEKLDSVHENFLPRIRSFISPFNPYFRQREVLQVQSETLRNSGSLLLLIFLNDMNREIEDNVTAKYHRLNINFGHIIQRSGLMP